MCAVSSCRRMIDDNDDIDMQKDVFQFVYIVFECVL